MWENNEELLKKDYSPKTILKENGCFYVKIERAIKFRNEKTLSEGLELNLETENFEKVRTEIFYKNVDGTQNEYGTGLVKQFIEILGITKENSQSVKIEEYKEEVLGLKNKKIILAISYEGVKEKISEETGEIFLNPKYKIKAIFDKNKLTTKEILEGTDEITTYQKWETIFKKQNRKREQIEKENREEIRRMKALKKVEENFENGEDDDFPF